MLVGYARVSTDQQKIDLQLRALKLAGCNTIFQDQGVSGYTMQRDGLERALNTIKAGSSLVVWRLDRLGRSLSGLISLIDTLGQRGIHFKSLMENIDTSSSGGRLIFHMMGALAEFERALISERTRAGLIEAKARGKKLGRPPLLNDAQIINANIKIQAGYMSIEDAASELCVSARTLKRNLLRLNRQPIYRRHSLSAKKF